jgi:hypothetical protein
LLGVIGLIRSYLKSITGSFVDVLVVCSLKCFYNGPAKPLLKIIG